MPPTPTEGIQHRLFSDRECARTCIVSPVMLQQTRKRMKKRLCQNMLDFPRARILRIWFVVLRGCVFFVGLQCFFGVGFCGKALKDLCCNGGEILIGSIKNLSRINQKRSQIDENASLERFRRQIAPKSAPRRLPGDDRVPFFHSWGWKCRSKRPF